jgi:hypothetical protein
MQADELLEDDEAIRQLLKSAGLRADDDSIRLECINNEKDEGKHICCYQVVLCQSVNNRNCNKPCENITR